MMFRHTIPCCKTRLKEVRSFVKRNLLHLSIEKETSQMIVLAIDEACANAIIHGNNCDEDKVLQIDLKIEAQNLAVEIYDVGSEYPKTTPEFTIDWNEFIARGKGGGIGLHLMKKIMDEVKFYHRDNIHICHLSKSWA